MENEPIARGDVTAMLARWQAGDEKALDALLPLVYDEIRSLAAAGGGVEIQSTAVTRRCSDRPI